MKRFLHTHVLLVGGIAALLLLSVGSTLLLSRMRPQPREGGVTVANTAPKQIATRPELTTTEVRSASAATAQYCSQNGVGKLLLVSISQQHIWACNGTQMVNESAVTTGASALTNVDDATPTGTWHIYSKQTNTTLKGCDVNGCWNDPVAYWMPFDDQVGFHDSSWQTFPYGSPLYTTQGSHGCVHLPLDFIGWVYSWAPVGTTVTVKA